MFRGVFMMSSLGRSACDHDDDMDEEGDDEENERAIKSGNDTCLASHEFEWLGPNSLSGRKGFSSEKCAVQVDTKQPYPSNIAERSAPPSSQSNPNFPYKRLSAFCPKQPPIADNFGYRLSPSPCWTGHGCYHVSPVRSSWCCPSPPPVVPFCCHHGGTAGPNTELAPYSGDICEDPTCYPYCSYTPSTYQPPQAHDLHLVHHHTSQHSSGKESPAPRSSSETRPSSRRVRSSLSKRRDYSPLSYSDASETMSPHLLPLPPRNFIEQNKGSLQKEFENSTQKIIQLEYDKKNLTLQVTVLTCQVEAQSEKINELESILGEMKAQIRHTEHLLQQEHVTRSAVENSKMLLMSEITNLKSKLAEAEKERKASDDKCRKIESDVLVLQSMLQKEDKLDLSRKTLCQSETAITAGNQCSETEEHHFTINSVRSSNEEKARKTEELRLLQKKCNITQDQVLSEHSKKALDQCVGDADFIAFSVMQESNLSSSPLSEGIKKKENLLAKSHKVSHFVVPVTSTPIETDISLLSWKESTVCQDGVLTNGRFSPVNSSYKSNSEENICTAPPKASQTSNSYGTVPRQTSPLVSLQFLEKSSHPELESRRATSKKPLPKEKPVPSSLPSNPVELNISEEKIDVQSKQPHSPRSKSSGVSFAPEEPVTIPPAETGTLSRTTTPSPIPSPLLIRSDKDRSKGFLRFLNKWKRSGSQNIEKSEGNFKRGELRATAGPRLGWSKDTFSQTSIRFSQWNTDLLVEWLNRIGLSMYISECKKWGCNGDKMLKSTSHELEKELGVKNALHKKKLVLALKSMNSELNDLPSAIHELDYHWVIRWLDDVGLPQYKDSFADSRVDGRVLHYLTVDDLMYLKVTNNLHHISIKRGIQVLREKKFDPHCLIRRSLPDESKTNSPELVRLWTNHRVMEWLRTVDLSEYAPNLRGSGVHGGLIIYEPKFNADAFASLLNIAPTKTLLRRHLTTHFKLVAGEDVMQEKRDAEADVSYVPLTPSLKIKAARKGQFTSKKKKGKKSDVEFEEYVCPLDVPTKEPTYSKLENKKLIVRRNSDPAPQEQRGFDIQKKEPPMI